MRNRGGGGGGRDGWISSAIYIWGHVETPDTQIRIPIRPILLLSAVHHRYSPLSITETTRAMAGQSRKWMILVATIWIQAFTGTNFDFSEYSSTLKSVMNISQVQLNYLATANDMGKVFGWSSGLALMYFPAWVVMFMAAFMGFIGYGLQYLVIKSIITLPYFLVRCFSSRKNHFWAFFFLGPFLWNFEDIFFTESFIRDINLIFLRNKNI